MPTAKLFNMAGDQVGEDSFDDRVLTVGDVGGGGW